MSQYHIYQTDADYRFESWKYAKDQFDFSDYEKVYSGELIDKVQYAGKTTKCNQDDRKVLEELYVTFNVNIPSDYHARSLSMSDIVEIVRADGSHYYYCDRIGWFPLEL